MINEIKKELLECKDRKYKDFSSKLLPGINNVLGVRLPYLRALAKKIAALDYEKFLKENDDEFFELTMLEGMVIGHLKLEYEKIIKYVEDFIPKINCWSICDSFCAGLKSMRKNKNEFKIFLEKYFNSKKEYELRFAYVMLIFHYMDDYGYVISKLKNFSSNDYYAKMAAAWCLAECFIRDFDETIKVLDDLSLSKWVLKKGITKAIESYRICDEQKERLKAFRGNLA